MPPPPKPAPPHRLELTTTSIFNTTLAVANDKIYYEVRTPWWEKHHTRIHKFDTDSRMLYVVADIEGDTPGKRGVSRVRFNTGGGKLVMKRDAKGEHFVPEEEKNGEWTPAAEWFNGDIFIDAKGEKYRWKTHNRMLQLIKADDETKQPLVKFHTHHRYFGVFRMRQHPWLEVKPEVDISGGDGNFLDKLIVSYVLAERRRRDASLIGKLPGPMGHFW